MNRRAKIKSGKVSKENAREKCGRAKMTLSPLSPQLGHIEDHQSRSVCSPSRKTSRRVEQGGLSPNTMFSKRTHPENKKQLREVSKRSKQRPVKKSRRKRMLLDNVAEIVRDDASDLEILLRKQ